MSSKVAKINQPTVIITGASGFVGSVLVRYFGQKGWQVIGLVRNPKRFTAKGSIRYVEYDLEKPFDDSFFKGATYLVHTAYIKYDRDHPDALKRNVEAAKRLLAAARKYKLAKTVFISSMSAHEEAVSVYGRQKLAIEQLFDTPSDVALRSGLIIGRGGIVQQMSQFMRSKHLVPLIGGGKQPLQIIAVGDLARVVEQALIHKEVSGVLTVANPRVYTYKSFYQTLARHLRTKVLFVPVPFYVLLGAMRTISLLPLPLSVNEDNLWGLKKLRSADTAKDLAVLGIEVDELEAALKAADATE